MENTTLNLWYSISLTTRSKQRPGETEWKRILVT
jgi:guanylate kinase